MDWPFVLGSFSAVMLFLCSVVVVAAVVHRKGNPHVYQLFTQTFLMLSQQPFL